MRDSLRRKLDKKKHWWQRRIEKRSSRRQPPIRGGPKTKIELSGKTNAVHCGGLAVMQQVVLQVQVGFAECISRHCPIFKMHMPYKEANHVFNIAFNLFAGGTWLEHLKLQRNDDAYLHLPGAQRIPDPTTTGDFSQS